MHFYLLSSNRKQMQSLTLEHQSYCESVRLLAPLPLCLFSCLFSPGVMQTPFHRQNILCRSCQSVYPQAWVPIWGLTSNIENWPAAPTASPAKRPRREWERESEGKEGGGGVVWGECGMERGEGGERDRMNCRGKRGWRRRREEVRGQEGSKEGWNERERIRMSEL